MDYSYVFCGPHCLAGRGEGEEVYHSRGVSEGRGVKGTTTASFPRLSQASPHLYGHRVNPLLSRLSSTKPSHGTDPQQASGGHWSRCGQCNNHRMLGIKSKPLKMFTGRYNVSVFQFGQLLYNQRKG